MNSNGEIDDSGDATAPDSCSNAEIFSWFPIYGIKIKTVKKHWYEPQDQQDKPDHAKAHGHGSTLSLALIVVMFCVAGMCLCRVKDYQEVDCAKCAIEDRLTADESPYAQITLKQWWH